MSEFSVEVVALGPVTKHPDADTLSVTQVHGGYPAILRTGQFKEGDRAVYVPVDAIVDGDRAPFAFLGPGKHRIKAKRLRGLFSMGLLVEAPEGAEVGADMREALGVEKYEAPLTVAEIRGDGYRAPEPAGPRVPHYDLDPLRRYSRALIEGEEVVLTEKIHGANLRMLFDGATLHVGSRTLWKDEAHDALWWPAVRVSGFATLLEQSFPPDLVFYGEIFGQVQDLTYGHPGKSEGPAYVRVFDAFDRKKGIWLDYDDLASMVHPDLRVPELSRGPWSRDLLANAEGPSRLAAHVREGFVVRPVHERVDLSLPTKRVVLKMHGQGYLTRKEKPVAADA